jgi:hypothetical protein
VNNSELAEGFGSQKWSDDSYYRGQFLAGKRSGAGLAYLVDTGTYEGTWVDDQIVEGIHIYLEASPYKTYSGQFKNWRPHGQGVLTFKNGAIYSGDFVFGYYQGHGTLRTNKFTYDGDWVGGRKEGWGTFSSLDYCYQGYWKKGVRHGLGFQEGKNSNYQGYWEDGEKSGYGAEDNANSPPPRRREGFWQKNEFIRQI